MLRRYQAETNGWVRRLPRRSRVCVQSPTGSGKSICFADLLLDDEPQLLVTHRRILLDQLSRVLTDAGVPHGFRAAGRPRQPDAPIQLAMAQTELAKAFKGKREWKLHPCTRIHWDELHTQTGAATQTICEAYVNQGATLVGWTATPSNIAHLVDELYEAVTVEQLITDGYLVPPVIYTPDGPSFEKLEAIEPGVGGEYSEKQIETVWTPKAIVARVLDNYFVTNPLRKPSILFAPGVRHSLWFAQQFRATGVSAAHIDGNQVWVDGKFYDSDSKARADVFERHKAGDIRVICNRYCLREGWDAPWIEHVILATIFGSRSSFVQSAGRGLRTYEGKTRCTFQDHGGNFWRFPPLDSDEPWDMGAPHRAMQQAYADKRREGGAPEPIVCRRCNAMRMSGPICPECKWRSEMRARVVTQLDGTLVLVEGPVYKRPEPKAPPTDAKIWERYFWGSRKHSRRTFNQVHRWLCKQEARTDFPRSLPLMPKSSEDWSLPVSQVPFDRLR